MSGLRKVPVWLKLIHIGVSLFGVGTESVGAVTCFSSSVIHKFFSRDAEVCE